MRTNIPVLIQKNFQQESKSENFIAFCSLYFSNSKLELQAEWKKEKIKQTT